VRSQTQLTHAKSNFPSTSPPEPVIFVLSEVENGDMDFSRFWPKYTCHTCGHVQKDMGTRFRVTFQNTRVHVCRCHYTCVGVHCCAIWVMLSDFGSRWHFGTYDDAGGIPGCMRCCICDDAGRRLECMLCCVLGDAGSIASCMLCCGYDDAGTYCCVYALLWFVVMLAVVVCVCFVVCVMTLSLVCRCCIVLMSRNCNNAFRAAQLQQLQRCSGHHRNWNMRCHANALG